MVERVLDLSVAQEPGILDCDRGVKAIRWVVPGSRLLATDRAADLQSGSPPSAGSLRTWEDSFAVTPIRPFAPAASSLDFPANRAQPCKRPVNLEIEGNSARVQIVYANVPGKRSRPAERTCLWC